MNQDVFSGKSIKILLHRLLPPGRCLLGDPERPQEWIVSGEAADGSQRVVCKADRADVERLVAHSWLVEHQSGGWMLAAVAREVVSCRGTGNESYRRQHQAIAKRHVRDPDGGMRTVEVDLAESPISWLRARRHRSGEAMISEEQFKAAERLHADFTRAQLAPRVTADWNKPCGTGEQRPPADALSASEQWLAAKQRFYKALAAVGPELAPILVEVCCFAQGIETAECKLNLPRRSGKVVLQLALTRLARAYGLLPAPEGSHRGAAMRGWGLEDFRPSFDIDQS